MSCDSCVDAERERFYQRQSVIKQAENYAIQHSVEMAIYIEAGGYFGYIRHDAAIAHGIPIIRIIPVVQGVDNGAVPTMPD
jgi:hypothetical protein